MIRSRSSLDGSVMNASVTTIFEVTSLDYLLEHGVDDEREVVFEEFLGALADICISLC